MKIQKDFLVLIKTVALKIGLRPEAVASLRNLLEMQIIGPYSTPESVAVWPSMLQCMLRTTHVKGFLLSLVIEKRAGPIPGSRQLHK